MNRSKAKGTLFESAVVKALRDAGWVHAERRALNGAADRGDVAGLPGVVIEVKNHKSMSLPEWWREALQEKENDGAELAVLWVKRTGYTPAEKGWVVMDGDMFIKCLRAMGY